MRFFLNLPRLSSFPVCTSFYKMACVTVSIESERSADWNVVTLNVTSFPTAMIAHNIRLVDMCSFPVWPSSQPDVSVFFWLNLMLKERWFKILFRKLERIFFVIVVFVCEFVRQIKKKLTVIICKEMERKEILLLFLYVNLQNRTKNWLWLFVKKIRVAERIFCVPTISIVVAIVSDVRDIISTVPIIVSVVSVMIPIILVPAIVSIVTKDNEIALKSVMNLFCICLSCCMYSFWYTLSFWCFAYMNTIFSLLNFFKYIHTQQSNKIAHTILYS